MTVSESARPRISSANAFALLAGASCAAVILALIVWAKGDFGSLRWIGITASWHAAVLIAVAALVARLPARILFAPPLDVRSTGAIRGVSIAAIAFLGTILAHSVILLFWTHASTAGWLTLSAAFFGMVIFGIPSLALGGILGAMLARRRSMVDGAGKAL